MQISVIVINFEYESLIESIARNYQKAEIYRLPYRKLKKYKIGVKNIYSLSTQNIYIFNFKRDVLLRHLIIFNLIFSYVNAGDLKIF